MSSFSNTVIGLAMLPVVEEPSRGALKGAKSAMRRFLVECHMD
jgi:hypothetical protein